MKLMIDIPEQMYEQAMENNYEPIYEGNLIAKTIVNGTIIKEGNWIRDSYSTKATYDIYNHHWYKCSVCGREVEDSPSGIKYRTHCKCGALMNGVVE